MRNLTRTALASGAVCVALTTPAHAATTVGETFNPTGGASCTANFTRLQTTSPGNLYAAPTAGVITAWSFHAGASPPSLKLKVGRQTTGDIFQIVGESPLKAPVPDQLNTYTDVRIPVRAGDVIGQYTTTFGACGLLGQAGYAFHSRNEDTPPGSPLTFTPANGLKMDLSAQLEPDADQDGYGDETQDQCPTDATAQGACPDKTAPETTINGGPIKTDKPKARFTFESSEPGSTFQCRLKGKEVTRLEDKLFNPCTSPKKYKKLDLGKYKFFAFATDAAGNPDLTPVKHKFRIVEEL